MFIFIDPSTADYLMIPAWLMSCSLFAIWISWKRWLTRWLALINFSTQAFVHLSSWSLTVLPVKSQIQDRKQSSDTLLKFWRNSRNVFTWLGSIAFMSTPWLEETDIVFQNTNERLQSLFQQIFLFQFLPLSSFWLFVSHDHQLQTEYPNTKLFSHKQNLALKNVSSPKMTKYLPADLSDDLKHSCDNGVLQVLEDPYEHVI